MSVGGVSIAATQSDAGVNDERYRRRRIKLYRKRGIQVCPSLRPSGKHRVSSPRNFVHHADIFLLDFTGRLSVFIATATRFSSWFFRGYGVLALKRSYERGLSRRRRLAAINHGTRCDDYFDSKRMQFSG